MWLKSPAKAYGDEMLIFSNLPEIVDVTDHAVMGT